MPTKVVNVALPDISADLGGSLSGQQWVVTGYTLMFSALLLLFAGTLLMVAGQAGFLPGLHLSLTATAVLILLAAVAGLALRRTHH